MTTLADMLRSVLLPLPLLPGAADHAREMEATDARAMRLQEQRTITREDARRIVVFTSGTWAQRYPERAYDLGEDAALFIADWLSARALGPETDSMHEALREWWFVDLAQRTGVAHEQRTDVREAIAKIQEDATRSMEQSLSRSVDRVLNRFERRRAASRRWRG